MSKSQKSFTILFFLTAWLGGAWILFSSFNPTPSEQYKTWLSTRRTPLKAGFLEKTAARYGFHVFAEQRAIADRQLTQELLQSPEYAMVIASWRDTGNRVRGTSPTWPYLEKAITDHFQHSDPLPLQESLSLATKEGFATWQLTLVRSAYLNNTLDDLTSIQDELRRFETKQGMDSSLSSSLDLMAQHYPLSASALARILLTSATDATTDAVVSAVLADRGLSPADAFSQLAQELKSAHLNETDWELVGRLITSPATGRSRSELLAWTLISPDCEIYRAKQLPVLEKAVSDLAASEIEIAKAAISEVFQQLTVENIQLPSDWPQVAGKLVDRVGEESRLSSLVSSEAAADFIWISHKLDKADLLDRAILELGDSISNTWTWIGEFIDREHYSAICRLVETTRDRIVSIDSRADPTTYKNPKDLSYYTDLIEKIVAHSQDEQIKGFIRLVIAMRAMENLRNKPGHEEAVAEVLKSIHLVNRSKSANDHILEQTVLRLVEEYNEIFEAGRPSFDKWRNGVTLDSVIEQIYRDEWQPGENEAEIWKKYAEKVETLDEAPDLKAIIEAILEMPPDAPNTGEVVSRMKNFLGISRSRTKNPESGNLELAAWPLKRMITGGDIAGAADWMFSLLRDFQDRYPGEDERQVLEHLYDEVFPIIRTLPPRQSIQWLECVLDEGNIGKFDWPESFYDVMHRDLAMAPDEAREILLPAFADHPLRSWIIRSLLENANLGNSLEDQKQTRNLIRQGVEEGWFIDVIDGINDRSINLDLFENDMANAPAGARRYFLNYLHDRSSPYPFKRHSSQRDLTEEERMRLVYWQAEQYLDILEKKRSFEIFHFDRVFQALLEISESQSGHPRMQLIMNRLGEINLDQPPFGMHSSKIDKVVRWKARTEFLRDTGTGEIENLLTNEDIPVTERAWTLVLREHPQEAKELILTRTNELNFETPPNVDRRDFLTGAATAFPSEFPKGSVHRLYAELYLHARHFPLYYQFGSGGTRHAWPGTARAFESFEIVPARLTRTFESTTFKDTGLEQKTFTILSRIRGMAALMPGKLESLKKSDPRGYLMDRLLLAELETLLPSGKPDQIREQLAAIDKLSNDIAPIDEAIDLLRYHFWRMGIRSEAFQDEDRRLLETLCFDDWPAKTLLGKQPDRFPHFQYPESLTRIRAMHFSLALIEGVPQDSSEYSWSNFDEIDFSRYREFWTDNTQFFFHAAQVVVARTRHLDEETRWSLLELFQTDPPGSPREKPVRTFTLFAGTGYITEIEIRRRGRDFATRFPEDGWTFITLARLGHNYGDKALKEFGLTQAARFAENDRKLKDELNRVPRDH